MSGTARSEVEEGGPGGSPRKALDLARSGPWFVGLFLTALVAFWPSYLSQIGSNSVYTHVHAVLATSWIGMLTAQPMLIRARRRDVHRAIGRASYAIAPLTVLSIVFLAHSRITGLEGEPFARQSYFMYLQASLAVVFALSWGLAVRHRRDMSIHARFMLCTGFTLIDPVFVRLMGVVGLPWPWNRQWFTFGLTDAVILALIWAERDAKRGRWVFPAMLAVFVASQLPALIGLTEMGWWQGFARWFATLPLT